VTATSSPPGGAHRGAWIAFVSSLLLYLACTSPVVFWGDSAEFARDAGTLELSPVARGYPLHRVACWLAGRVAGDAALGANLVSALFAAAGVGLVYEAARRLSSSVWGGVAAAFALGFAHTFWTYAVVAEVYSLHTAIFLAALVVAVDYDGSSRRHRVLLGAILGLSLLHHRIIAFSVPGIAAWTWIRTPAPARWRAARDTLVGFLLGAVPFAVLCAVASRSPPADCTNPVTWWFEDVFLGGEQNAAFMLVEQHKTLAQSAAYLGRWLAFNLPGPGLALAGYGFVAARRSAPRGTLTLLALLVAANLWFPLRYDWTGDQYSFLVPLYPVLAIAAGIGAGRIAAVRGAAPAAVCALACAAAPVALYCVLALTPLGERAFPGLNASAVRTLCLPVRAADTSARDVCRSRIGSLPRDAVLHCDWGDGQVYLYLQEREGLRPDVEVRIWYRSVRTGAPQGREEWVSVLPFTRAMPQVLAPVADRLEPAGDGLFRVR
jgi:hypothetical protein